MPVHQIDMLGVDREGLFPEHRDVESQPVRAGHDEQPAGLQQFAHCRRNTPGSKRCSITSKATTTSASATVGSTSSILFSDHLTPRERQASAISGVGSTAKTLAEAPRLGRHARQRCRSRDRPPTARRGPRRVAPLFQRSAPARAADLLTARRLGSRKDVFRPVSVIFRIRIVVRHHCRRRHAGSYRLSRNPCRTRTRSRTFRKPGCRCRPGMSGNRHFHDSFRGARADARCLAQKRPPAAQQIVRT